MTGKTAIPPWGIWPYNRGGHEIPVRGSGLPRPGVGLRVSPGLGLRGVGAEGGRARGPWAQPQPRRFRGHRRPAGPNHRRDRRRRLRVGLGVAFLPPGGEGLQDRPGGEAVHFQPGRRRHVQLPARGGRRPPGHRRGRRRRRRAHRHRTGRRPGRPQGRGGRGRPSVQNRRRPLPPYRRAPPQPRSRFIGVARLWAVAGTGETGHRAGSRRPAVGHARAPPGAADDRQPVVSL